MQSDLVRSAPASRPLLIRDAQAVLTGHPAGTRVSILVERGRISGVGPFRALKFDELPGAEVIDARGLWALPGLIDLQLNDIEWLARGKHPPKAHAARIREVLAYQAARGVTGCVLATLAAPLDEVVAYLEGMRVVLDGARRGDRVSPFDGCLLGGLVEGTFMNPELHGAHNPKWVLEPNPAVLERLLATGAVRCLNVAPETSPRAIEVIARAAQHGVVVGCGHAKPHAERVREAVAAGLRYVIHLGNGPTGSQWKRFHDGGLLEEALRNDDLWVTLIADGWHVHRQLLRDWIARKGVHRSIGISDAGFATGVPEGRFSVFGIEGERAPDGNYLRVVPRAGAPTPNPLSSDAAALFGSAMYLDEVFENLVNLFTQEMEGVYTLRHEAMPLEEAVDAAARMCAANPAALLGLEDRGTLGRRSRADIVLARIEGKTGAKRVEVKRVYVAGQRVENPAAT
jgi:N-acetylglucosamine-6-phosphate deacetylase